MKEEQQHPIENLMLTAMTSIENMVDVNTIIGDIVTSPDGTVIIPVSKVNFGFAAGGSEFNSTCKQDKSGEAPKLPFGGGSGAGVGISPVAFLVVKDGNTKLLTLNGTTTAVDKLIDLMPDVINKANRFFEKNVGKKRDSQDYKDYDSDDLDEEYDDDDDEDEET